MTEIVKNHRRHIIPYASGEKFITARLPGTIESGVDEEIILATPEGEEFGRAKVASAIRGITLEGFVEIGFEGHKQYDSVDEAIEEFEGYYPEEDITPVTTLDVVRLKDIEVDQEFVLEEKGIKKIHDRCPECDSTNLVYQEACKVCKDCGAMNCTGDVVAANT